MMKENQTPRRQFLKIGGAALAIIPLMVVFGRAHAETNNAQRTFLKYQGTPNGDKSCVNCSQFVPDASLKDLGRCNIISLDTEISPQGYCIRWAKKP